jgi:hypothetical protein
MSDSRWADVDRDIDLALKHFGMADRIFQADGFDAPDGWLQELDFLHARDGGRLHVGRECLEAHP